MIITAAILLSTFFTRNVCGHGYLIYPIARQFYCYSQHDYNWPFDGSGINNDACKAAYVHIYEKYGGNSAVAQAMFYQNTEYAALAGSNYRNRTFIQREIVPNFLCAAGANDASKQFGDKSGMDIVSDKWHATQLMTPPGPTNLYFCPTVLHEPSYFEAYVSKKNYNPAKTHLRWSDLELIYANVSKIINRKIRGCSSESMYVLENVVLPPRDSKFIIYVRWQREDSGGEGFYNCADVYYSYKNNKYEL
nr:GP37 [Darna trima granulovirus]